MGLDGSYAPRRLPRVPSIDVDELHHRLRLRQAALILDVREPWEFAEGHVPGAQLVPLSELEDRVHELPRDRPVYSICHSGQRSLAAAVFLLSEGFSEVSNVEGGTSAWLQRGFAVDR